MTPTVPASIPLYSTALRWLAWLLLPMLASSLRAYERTLYFQPLDTQSTLAQNTVSAVHTDHLGFLWIATQAGLHRYDGEHLELIQHDPSDPLSLPDNLVSTLAEDDRGQLWIGTNSAYLAVLDLETGRLRHMPRSTDPAANQVTALHHVSGDGLWVATMRGVQRIASGTQIAVDVLPGGADSPPVLSFASFHGALYLASAAGVRRLTAGAGSAELVSPEAAQTLAVAPDSGRLWVGGERGLFELTTAGLARRWPPSDQPDVPIQTMSFDPRGRLWLGIRGQGVVRFDPAGSPTEWFRQNRNLPGALPEDNLLVAHVDPSGLLWIGGETSGLTRAPTEGSRFILIKDMDRLRASSNNIRSFHEDPDGSLWMGTEGDGLKRYDPGSGTFTYFDQVFAQLLGRAQPPGDLRMLSLAADPSGRLWIGTNYGLFSREPVAPEGGGVPQFRHWPLPELFPAQGNRIPIRSLTVDRNGRLWLASAGRGVLELDASTATVRRAFRHDPAQPASLAHDFVLKVHEDRRGRLWFGTLQGLSMLDPASGRWQRFRFNKDDPGSLPGDLVRAFHEDGSDRLWLGTHSGLAEIVEQNGQVRFRRIDVRTALPSATVYGILSDGNGMLWLSSNSGLAQLDPGSGRLQAFGLLEGLQGLEFNGDAALQLRNGELVFGGIAGVNRFRAERFTPNPWNAPVRFTAFAVSRKPQIQRFFGDAPHIEIAQDERIVDIAFAALDFRDPRRNRHAWRLRGFDDDWIEGHGHARATYTNLDPGDYVLEARGSNRDGHFSSQELKLELRVLPPWWWTRGARGTYAVLASLVLCGLLLERQRRRVLRREHLNELREREERLSVCLWGSSDDFWDWDIQRGVLYRHGTEQLLGTNMDGRLSEMDWMRSVVHPDDLPLVRVRMETALSGEQPHYESEHRIRAGATGWVWVLARGKVVERDGNGRPLRMAGTARNISHLRAAQQELRISAEVIHSMSEGVAVLDLDLCFVSVNPAFERVTGYAATEVIGQPTALLDSPRHSEAEYASIRAQMVEHGRWRGELWLRRKDASDLCAALEVVRIRREQQTDLVVAVLNDITERKRAELELKYLANFDALTGLPNRTMFSSRLLQAVRRANRRKHRLALLFIDLDRFKQINDTLGHAAGDELLRATSQRMTASVPPGTIVARLGGDEFTVLLPEIATEPHGLEVAQQLLVAFSDPINLGGNEVVISPSIGIAFYPEHGEDPGTLLKHADAAMYSAKDAGRNTFRVYNDQLAHLTRQRVALEAGLRRALERREFQLVFQPIVRLSDRRITALETLLRWHHPEFGTIAPDVFVPILEESGMVVTVGSWVLSEALAQLKHWRQIGFAELKLAVNISTLQLLRGELDAEIAERLRHFDLPGACLELELTESLVMANPEQSIRALDALAAQGVRIVVDDFGTGYSSLSYLKKLPIEKLKIDKSFIRDIGRDPDDTTIVNIVIALAHVLELHAVAEGVETAEQLDFLESSGCDEAQGFLLCRPLPAAEIERFMLDYAAGQKRDAA